MFVCGVMDGGSLGNFWPGASQRGSDLSLFPRIALMLISPCSGHSLRMESTFRATV